ncbi:MAG: glycosyltransferase family 2 protein [Desulfobacteraceae bacterium]|nr:glycosyltransferase family 2 protein [Desulfobacteraceae bacterium]
MLIESFSQFFASLDFWKMIAYFWPFFFIDMMRYLFLDFFVLLFYIPRRRMRKKVYKLARQKLFHELPLVSVLVPGKNEGRHITSLVDTLAQQTYKHIELIVVDDGSDDDTPLIGRRLQKLGKITLFIRNEIRGGKASAANTALKFARGKYIIHLDADSHLKNNAVETILLPFFINPDIGAVGGDVRVANIDAGIVTRLQAIEYFKSISTGRTVSSQLGILRIIAGAHGAFRRDVLQRIYGWDVGPGLDGDVTLKIRKLGFKVIHEPFAICYTNVPNSFLKLIRQRFRWDRSLIRFRVRKHRDILLPSKNFSIKNFLASAENIFFNLIFDIKWWIYIIQIFIFARDYIEVIFIINLFIYSVVNFLEFALAVALLGKTLRPRELLLIVWLPLIPLYTGFLLRSVRTFAYIMEILFKASFFDRWNPWKVSKISKKDE